jgi:hypothetical protein
MARREWRKNHGIGLLRSCEDTLDLRKLRHRTAMGQKNNPFSRASAVLYRLESDPVTVPFPEEIVFMFQANACGPAEQSICNRPVR